MYLKALHGKGAHLITVNDYLASRDAEWMGEVYKFLGLSVGIIQHDMTDEERQAEMEKCDMVARMAKQMINNADVILRTNKLQDEGKLKNSAISKVVG